MSEIKITIELPERLDQTLDCLCSSLWTIAQAIAAGAPAPAAAPAAEPGPVFKVLEKVETPEGLSVKAAPANVAAVEVVNKAAAEHPVDAVPPATADDVQTVAPAPDPAPAAAPAKSYTLEEVRKAVMAMSRKGPDVKAKVKAALNKYAESVPALPSEKYAEFMADLEALGNG